MSRLSRPVTQPAPQVPERLGLLAVVGMALLVLAACGSTVGQAAETGSVTEQPAGDQQSDTGQEFGTTNHAEVSSIHYRCGDLTIGLDQLLMLDELPQPDVARFDRLGGAAALGERGNWATLTPQHLIDRRPLGTEPPGLIVADDEGRPEACVAIRTGEDRPVAWRIDALATDGETPRLTVAVESCVNAEDVMSDVLLHEGDAIVTLALTSRAVSAERSCLVDGSTTVDLALPTNFDGSVRSGQTWPFIAPDPEYWVTGADAPPVVPIDEAQFDTASCEATSGVDGVGLSWRGVPAGALLDVVADGEILTSAGRASGSGRFADELAAALAARLEGYGVATPEAAADRQPDGVFSLFGAPPEPGSFYELRLQADGVSVDVPCGNAGTLTSLPALICTTGLVNGTPQLTVANGNNAGPLTIAVFRDDEQIGTGRTIGPANSDSGTGTGGAGSEAEGEPAADAESETELIDDPAAEPGETYRYHLEVSDNRNERAPTVVDCGTVMVPDPAQSSQELANAEDRFNQVALGAHVYLTMVLDGTTTDLYMEPSRSFSPALADDQLINPFTLHQDLMDAMAAGRTVEYELDPLSGAPTSWTVDGTRRELLCIELDTAPPDLRQGGCDPTRDLIGS